MGKLKDVANELLADGMSIRELGDLFIFALKSLKEDESENPQYQSDEKLNDELEITIKTFLDKRLLEQRDKARENVRIEIAINLFDVLDIETIADKTNLTVEKVKELKENHLKDKKV